MALKSNELRTFFNKVLVKLTQYYEGYILRKPNALIALDYLRKNKIYDYRYRYNLPKGAIIFDCGGYKGNWSERILKLYGDVLIYIFEINTEYVEQIQDKFRTNENIKVFPFGLGSTNRKIQFVISDVATGVFTRRDGNNQLGYGEVYDVNSFLEKERIARIDLLKINIEGGEYELLDTLIESGNISKCINIQIQFHNFGEWCILKRDAIKEKLRETHICTYDFEWTFENWQLKTPSND